MPRLWRFDLTNGRLSELPGMAAPRIVTSKPYPAQVEDHMQLSATLVAARMYMGLASGEPDRLAIGANLVGGSLRAQLQNYANTPDRMAPSAVLVDGSLRTILRGYGNWPAEGLAQTAGLVDGTLKLVLRAYSNWPAEGIALSAGLIGGTLS